VLFDLTTARLIARKVLLPGVSVLTRLIAQIRDRSSQRLWRRLSQVPNAEQRARLETLLDVPAEAQQSTLERLRRAPTRVSARAMADALERIQEIRSFGVSDVDLSGVPVGRVDAMARYASAARAQAIARMPEDRRSATLLALAHTLEPTAIDDALDLLDLLLAKRRKRLRTLKDLDSAAVQLRETFLMIIDPAYHDLEQLREAIFERFPRTMLLEAANRVAELAQPNEDHHYGELLGQYLSVRRFLPKLLKILDFEGLESGRPVLDALKALRWMEGRRRIGREDVHLDIVTIPWRRSVLSSPGEIDRRSYTFCVLDRLRTSLHRREIFVPRSTRLGDPRTQLLSRSAWEGVRIQVCRTLNLPPTFEPELKALSQMLNQAYHRTASRIDVKAQI
jgi:hypothetical protein